MLVMMVNTFVECYLWHGSVAIKTTSWYQQIFAQFMLWSVTCIYSTSKQDSW